jgi:anti-sigma regulatory factor (Ser/Thr protein kinase)
VTVEETRLSLEIPVAPHYGQEVRRQVLDFASHRGIGEDCLTDFLTALGEALANAFEHSKAQSVEVAVMVTSTHILAEIRDSGVGFESEDELLRLPDPNAERGRGLPLMRRCCDVFEILSKPGAGTSVVVGCTLVSAAE